MARSLTEANAPSSPTDRDQSMRDRAPTGYREGVTACDFVIFDLDGTLVDSAPDIAWALGAALTEAGVAPPPLDEMKAMVGDGARPLVERALERAGASRDVDALLARYLEHYRDHLCVDSRIYPGILNTLDQLRRAGVRSAVVTNKPGTLARGLLDQLGLTPLFTAIVGDGDGFPRKPDPGAARAVIERAGGSASGTAVIGDGLADLRMARAAGARAIAASWGYVPADRLAAEAPDLMARTPEEAVAAVLGGD
jgi:phosphoglycolate phosphatase